MLVKAFELSCVRRQSLKVARLLENQSSNMKTLKALADPNLKHDTIAAMRYPRPHKRTSIHEASGKSQSSHQYASHLRRCIFVFQNCGVSCIGIFAKLEYCAAAKVSVDWVRASDVVAPQSAHDGRARDDDFFTSTEPCTSCAPRVPARWRLALGHHGSSLRGIRLQTDRIQYRHLFHGRHCPTRRRSGIGLHRRH